MKIAAGIRLLFSILIFTLCTSPLLAQGIEGGLKVGMNVSNVKIKFSGAFLNGSVNGEAAVGLHVGAFIKAMISDKFGVQPEMLYSQQGNKTDNGRTRMDFLNIPVLFRYQLNDMVHLDLGPQAGFLLTAKDADGDDFKDALSGFSFSISSGLGVDLPSGFTFAARYNGGISNDADTDATGFGNGNVKLTQSVFMFSVGYSFFGEK